MFTPNRSSPISLKLECLEARADKFVLRLTLQNNSTVSLLVPYPEITLLKFWKVNTRQFADWCTTSLNTTSGTPVAVVAAGGNQSMDYIIRPYLPETPALERKAIFSKMRWALRIKHGTYLVSCNLIVNDNFYDPDSHWRLRNLQKEADKHQVRLWTGAVTSNELTIEY